MALIIFPIFRIFNIFNIKYFQYFQYTRLSIFSMIIKDYQRLSNGGIGMILDSGARQEFQSGAVRDVTEGKGRCDLLPLDVVAELMGDNGNGILSSLNNFVKFRDTSQLFVALYQFASLRGWSEEEMLLEVSKHFEEGAKKYAERNWEKGIPLHCYLDSAVRHYLKYRGGWTDECHDRAFVWNVMCMWWTYLHKPELDDLPKEIKE